MSFCLDLTRPAIARHLGISLGSVRAYIDKLGAKAGAKDRGDFLVRAIMKLMEISSQKS